MRLTQFFSKRAARFAFAPIFALAAAMAPADPPPPILHYQGLLLDNANQPITTGHPVVFSIYEGGSATVAHSGTLKYQEFVAQIIPDLKGVFEYNIGSNGTLTSAIFNTANPLFLEVAVDNANNVLLPRARITTVGYAFVADNAVGNITPKNVSIQGFGQVIDSTGGWTGKPITVGGIGSTPSVTTVADNTGGLLVPGDILRIDGSGLGNSTVLVGGKAAPIKTRTAAQILCQIPAGTPMGLNAVTLSDPTANGSTTIAHVDVHRLLVELRTTGGNGRVNIFDANTGTQVNAFNVNTVKRLDGNSNPLSLQSGIGMQGALLLLPSGFGSIYAIDLTANPPALVATLSTGTDVRGVDISPDGKMAIICDFQGSGGSQIRAVALTQAAPPFTSGLFGASNSIESGEVPTGFGATGVQFIGNGQFIVLGRNANQLILYYRLPGSTGSNIRDIERIPPGDMPFNSADNVGTGPDPVRLQLTPDQTRLLVTNRGSSNLQVIYAATFWPAGFSPAAGAPAGPRPLKAAIAPDGASVWTASFGTSSSGDTVSDNDRLKVFSLVADTIALRGEIPGPRFNSNQEAFEMAAIEPVDGKLLAVATNKDKLYITPRAGNSVAINNNDQNNSTTYLSLPSPIQLDNGQMDCVELLFQP